MAEAGGSGVGLAGVSTVTNTTRLLVATTWSRVGGGGVSVSIGKASVSAAGDWATATTWAGDCWAGKTGKGSCPLKKNAAAIMAAITPVTLVTMRARRARIVSSSRTMGNMVARASRAERLAMLNETTITARLNPARVTSNQDSKDMAHLFHSFFSPGATTFPRHGCHLKVYLY
jgi:hypothetical protein